jgi:hypothetical protein
VVKMVVITNEAKSYIQEVKDTFKDPAIVVFEKIYNS